MQVWLYLYLLAPMAIFFNAILAGPPVTCPRLCVCQWNPKSEVTVNCSGSPMKSVPSTIPQNTIILDMRHTGLSNLPSSTFRHLHRLKALYIGGNDIRAFHEDTYVGLKSLELLDISPIAADVRLDYTFLPPPLFRDLTSLRTLKIGTVWQNIDNGYVDRTLVPLQMLEQLILPSIPLNGAELGPGYKNLTSLKTLVFQGKRHQAANQLKKRALIALKRSPIERLAIIYGSITSVESGTMSVFPKLKTLDMESCKFFSPQTLQEFICDLNYTLVETIRMNSVLSYDALGPLDARQALATEFVLSASTFGCLKHKVIKSLELIKNSIVSCDLSFLESLPYLEYIDLSYNDILYFGVPTGTTLDQTTRKTKIMRILQVISLSKLKFFKFDHNVLSYGPDKPEFRLSHSFWYGHPQLPQCQKSIIYRNSKSLKRRDSDSLYEGHPGNLTMHGPVLKLSLPENGEYFSSSWLANVKYGVSRCDSTEFRSVYFYPNNLRYLNVVGVGLPGICQTIYGLHRLEIFDLSHNKMYYLPKDFAVDFPSLKQLFLKGNKLGPLIGKGGIHPFRLPRLEDLDLSQNEIYTLPKDLFVHLHSLKRLNLNSNRLKTVAFRMTGFGSVQHIDLGNNLLGAFSSRELTLIGDINNNSQITVNMSRNPVDCTGCDGMEFIHWLVYSNVNVTFTNDTSCHMNDTQTDLVDTLNRLQVECDVKESAITANHWLSLGLSLTGVAGLACTLVLGYIYRWNIKYRLYLLRRRLRRRDVINALPGHVYISYDDNDYDWVVDELLRQLEDENELDVIIDQRDFIGGAALGEAIVEAVDNSRKTVLVLSEAYMQNPWCEFEFQMSLARGYHSVIPVMFQHVPFQIMPKSLRTYVKARGYIKWKYGRDGQNLFWGRLTDAIFNSGPLAVDEENEDVEML